MPSKKSAFLLTSVVICSLINPIDVEAESKLPEASKKKVNFVRDIAPLLSKHCVQCHGAEKSEGGLRLDQRKAALGGGDSGKVILSGKSVDSRLIQLVAGIDDGEVMPPEGNPLKPAEVGLLRAWIDQGAKWPDLVAENLALAHWAYQPVQKLAPPKTQNNSWGRNEVDAFVLARLESQNVKPSDESSRATLIRRLNLDLLGLLPSVKEVNSFLNDKSPKAYEDLVDRLLKSPHFGERWGRHWLDKARYADSDGYEKDRPRPNAWRWRDWVIRAINDDMPFDQFTIEQQAGDLLPNATQMQRLATAFHRQTLTNTEGGTDQEQFRVEATFDRIETTGTVWLGLTVGCARCHSHKYDQISQNEYYRLFAFFNNGDETNTNVTLTDAATYAKQQAEHETKLEAKQSELKTTIAALQPDLEKWKVDTIAKLANVQKNPPKFHPLETLSVKGPKDVTFTVQDDRSYLVGGASPSKGEYTVELKTDLKQITGFKIEVLPHESLPSKGPGRAPNGNFVLTEIRAYAAENRDLKPADKLTFVGASADYSQQQFAPTRVFDGNDQTGWAIASKMGKPHQLILSTKALVNFSGTTRLQIVLSQTYNSPHMIGRFRISAMTGQVVESIVPGNIAKLLQIPKQTRNAKQSKELLDFYVGVNPRTVKIQQEIANIQKNPPKTMSVRVVTQRTSSPRTTFVLHRGDFLRPKKEQPIIPAGLASLPRMRIRNDGTQNRMDLARWLVDSSNPLTPRVTVNHIWSHLFGRGIVGTVNDFGVRGDLPTHPKLLDWLSHHFVHNLGWSRKQLIKTIVMSATYQQSSMHRGELRELDPKNELLHRQNRVRVEAEIIRDLTLHASGLLSTKVGGPSVFPPLPKSIAELSYANNFKWKTSKGADRYRRGMYTFFKRTAPHPNLTAFDCPDSNVTCVERRSSNTPLQALTTLNNEVFVEAAQAFSKRVLSMKFDSDGARMSYAIQICVSRIPSNEEVGHLLELLQTARAWYREHQADAKKLIGSHRAEGVGEDEAAAWTAAARIVLNFDEFVTRD